jgi:Rrf2 family transcriptional regulator, nitric oxide-sensitive transcriptional repressor
LRLTTYTDYALRLLMYVAVNDDGLATISEVAAGYGISKNHLMKVAHQLGLAGYVETVRGRSGGLRLAKPAEAIGLGDVVRRTEQDMALVPCFDPADKSCAIRSCGILRRALEKASAAFLAVLDDYTLGDLVKPRTPLRALLAIEPPSRARLAPARKRAS